MFAALTVLGFSTFLAVAGVGSAFIVVPVFYLLGIPLPVAMTTGLLLNTVSMVFASINNAKNRYISYKTAIPITIVATALSPLGVCSSKFVNQNLLLWFFASFLIFASFMMLFYKPRSKSSKADGGNHVLLGGSVGAFAGYVGGLLGVGGGNIIIPALVWRGFDSKKASGTTAFVVIFSSLSGFISRANLGQLNYNLLLYALLASVAGGLLGSWLMKRLNSAQVKMMIAVVLLVIAGKIVWGLA